MDIHKQQSERGTRRNNPMVKVRKLPNTCKLLTDFKKRIYSSKTNKKEAIKLIK